MAEIKMIVKALLKALLILEILSAACHARPEDSGSVATHGYCFVSGGDGRCVPYYLCKGNLIITEPSADIDIRVPEPTSPCANYIDICCQNGQILEKNP